MIPVAEIFGPTIQGEGPEVGKRVIFVRVVGCDFNCSWCDSKFAWKVSENTKRLTPEELANEIISKCLGNNCHSVVITGGNPCLYDLSKVIESLHEHDIRVSIETQGSKFPDWLSDVDTLVFSPKAPSSKQLDTYNLIKEYLYYGNYSANQLCAIKIPVFNEEDIQFAIKFSELVNERINTGMEQDIRFYLSVGNDNTSEEGSIRDRILTTYEKLIERINENPKGFDNVFILPQVHTLIWGNRQGV